MTKISLKAEKRTITGRKVKNLRKQGIIPANIYGKDVKSVSVQVKGKEFGEAFKKAGETGIIDLTLGKDVRPVLVGNVSLQPATGEVLHVDFRQVNLKEKVTAAIPVELIGESPAEKGGLGTAVLLVQELEVEALPTDLPEKFEVDATKLAEVDQAVKVADLKYDKSKVEVKAEPDEIVAKVEPPQKEEEIPAPTPQAVEGEAPAEGEKPAEGGEVKAEEKAAEAPQEKK